MVWCILSRARSKLPPRIHRNLDFALKLSVTDLPPFRTASQLPGSIENGLNVMDWGATENFDKQF